MLPLRRPRVLICAALSLAVACSNAAHEGPDAGPAGFGGATGGAAGSIEGKGGSVGTGGAAGGRGGGMAGAGGVAGGGGNVAGNGGAGGPKNVAGYAYTGEYAGAAGAPVCSRGGSGGTISQGIGGGGEPFPCQTFSGVPDCPDEGPVCGNGVRDTCIKTRAGDRCPRYSFTELCDGTEGIGAVCAGLGFGSGNVTCTASCTFDTSACSECLPIANLAGCGPVPVTTAQPLAMAIAATDAEVALAWVEQDPAQPPTLHFARLSPSLELIRATAIPDPAFAAATSGLAAPAVLAVAPLPSGWVVAGYAAPELFLQAIDATGQPVARLVVAQVPAAAATAGSPILAARADGGPLLVWSQGGEIRAAVVAADGRSTTASVVLSTAPARVLGSPSAIFGRDTFSVVFSVDGGANRRQLRLARVGTDGILSGVTDALLGTDVWNATLGPSQARGSSDLTVVYQRFANPCVTDQGLSIYAQRIGYTGVPLADAVLVGRPGEFDGWAETTAFTQTDSSMLLLRAASGQAALSYGWIKAQGKEFGTASRIALDSSASFRSLNLVRCGNEAIAAWLVSPRPGIRMARVKY